MTDVGGKTTAAEELRLDATGSLIDLKKNRRWLVGFVPPINDQFWHRFFHRDHKHCFAMRYAGNGMWTLVEPWWTRIQIATIDGAKANKFLTWAKRGDLVGVSEHVPGASSQIRGWMTCAALCAHLLGRSYMVYTPHQLFRRLMRERDVAHFTNGQIDAMIHMNKIPRPL